MRIAVRNLTWVQDKRVKHGMAGMLALGNTVRKVAMLVDENRNPLRPAGATVPAKPFTLELYIPLPVGMDKVLKFDNDASAKAEASRQLSRFIADATEAM